MSSVSKQKRAAKKEAAGAGKSGTSTDEGVKVADTNGHQNGDKDKARLGTFISTRFNAF